MVNVFASASIFLLLLKVSKWFLTLFLMTKPFKRNPQPLSRCSSCRHHGCDWTYPAFELNPHAYAFLYRGLLDKRYPCATIRMSWGTSMDEGKADTMHAMIDFTKEYGVYK